MKNSNHSSNTFEQDKILRLILACRGFCVKYKVDRPTDGLRYVAGQKRCNPCSVFIEWDGLFCPCCGSKLRIKPKTSLQKRHILVKRI